MEGRRPSDAAGRALVLVVDDDSELREALSGLLGSRGFRVVEREAGDTALRYLREGERPDLILLDLVMPEMDGWELRAALLDDADLSTIPVVALSADGSAKARALHAAAFVPKPINMFALTAAIDRLLPADGARRDASAGPARRSARRDAYAGSIRGSVRVTWRDPARAWRAARDRPGSAQVVAHTAEGAAELAERARGREMTLVSSSISHVVNNALQNVLVYAETVSDQSEDDAALKRSVIASVRRAAQVIDRFGVCARAMVNKPAVVHEPWALALHDVWRALCPAGTELRVGDLRALAQAHVRTDWLHEIMGELIANAAEAQQRGRGTIRVEAGTRWFEARELEGALPQVHVRSGRWHYLEVSDDGSGIEQAALPYLFMAFFSTRFPGRGLGLTLVQARMRALNGLISVHTELGAGTRVRLLFPAA